MLLRLDFNGTAWDECGRLGTSFKTSQDVLERSHRPRQHGRVRLFSLTALMPTLRRVVSVDPYRVAHISTSLAFPAFRHVDSGTPSVARLG